MLRGTGPALLAIGLLHVLYVLIAGRAPLARLVRRGIGGLKVAPPAEEAPFWSLLLGAVTAAIGAHLAWAEATVGAVPASPGRILVGVGLAGGLALAPVSPFWLVLITGAAVIARARVASAREATAAGTDV
jgi:hypothetical protein